MGCGTVACTGPTVFGNGQAIPFGPETGGREVAVYAEISVEVAAALTQAAVRRGALARYERLVARYRDRVRSERVIIERGAVVRDTVKVLDAYLGPHAVIDGAALVRECTLLSSADEPARVLSGAAVTSALLQWGSRAETGALVERSVLTEHSAVERHGKVAASLLGPNTAVGQGEVTAALLGPFVGFHHQAMLIAAVWPEGRGNVSHGANVGANHTSRAPDQEARLGEGTFFGLGVNVKYPIDLSRAPYCVIACGVTLPPQRIEFPFALVNVPSAGADDVPPGANEIVPAWGLSDNLYALKRAEWKHRARDQARRSRFTFDIFRPDTVDLMRAACARLEAAPPARSVYTECHLDGLGKNYLTQAHRQKALEAYRFHTRLYALLGLYERALAAARERRRGAAERLLDAASDDPRWEHQRGLLVRELRVSDVACGLRELPGLLERMAGDVERSKARDDVRGPRVIADYADVHVPAERDPFVRQTWGECRRVQEECRRLLAHLEGRSPAGGQAAPAPADGWPQVAESA
jgi:hypothetical protein